MKYLLASLLLIPTPAAAELSLEVDHSELSLHVLEDGKVIHSYPVAMGKPGTYVPYGTHSIRSVDMNPSWRGTRGQGFVPSGPRSPLGRVRMRFDGYYALHGTIAPASIGTYASLGCIRMHNEDVIQLTEMLLKDTNSWRGDSWYSNMLAQPRRMFSIPLNRPVIIRIVE